jgi:RimJ/RimL family protein N-acetyltransferase
MPIDPSELSTVDLLQGIELDRLDPVARRLTGRDLPAGCTVIRQGEDAVSFALVVDGELVVTRLEGEVSEELAVVGPGSIVGELALLRERARAATVTTCTDARVLTGDREVLVALLHLPTVAERLRELISLRLAEDAAPVPVRAADGTELALRPLRPDDREGLLAGIDAMSDESLYRRFFTGGRPGEAIIEHLLDVDYLDRFAWVLGEPDGARGLGVARYNRRPDDPNLAEAAFAVVDDQQGHGLGTVMLGALAVAAGAAGIERLRAEVLSDNRPMRAVLDKADATWSTVEAGVVATEVDVGRAQAVLDDATIRRLERSVRDIVTASGLVLARRVE